MATSFKRSHAHTATFSALKPPAGHLRPMPLPETPGHLPSIWVNLLWGHCSFLLGPAMHNILFVPSKSLFPWCCLGYGSSMVGWQPPPRELMPYPGLLHPEPLQMQQATAHLYLHRRHTNTQRQVWLSLCGASWFTQAFI